MRWCHMSTSSAASSFGDTCVGVLLACTYASIAHAQWLSGSAIPTERLEHRTADVLVDDRGAHVGHLAALGEAIDHERVQRVGVVHGDVQQEVVAPGDDEHPDGLRQGAGPVAEGLDVRARRWADAH